LFLGRWEVDMRRRRKFVLLLAPICVLLSLLGWSFYNQHQPSARINPLAYERIEAGMTQSEVETIIGLPPGDYRSNLASPRHRAEFVPKAGVQILEWEVDDCNIQVRVDEQSGRVLSKICGEPLPSRTRRFFNQLRERAGW
jgi:hypothetical protein